MRITYDRQANAVYLHLTDQPLPPGHSTTRAQAPHGLDAFIALDWRGNQLIGIEILDASTVLPADLLNHAEIIYARRWRNSASARSSTLLAPATWPARRPGRSAMSPTRRRAATWVCLPGELPGQLGDPGP